MNTRRLTCGRRGGVNSAGMRPSSVTSDSSTMARARNPRERSWRLTQLTAVTTPSRANAIAPAFCAYTSASFKVASRRRRDEEATHLRGKGPCVDRFGDEAATTRRGNVVARSDCCERDYRNGRRSRVGLQTARDREAVLETQMNIHEDQVRTVRADPLMHLARRGGEVYPIALTLEDDRGNLLVVLVVLDHEDR